MPWRWQARGIEDMIYIECCYIRIREIKMGSTYQSSTASTAYKVTFREGVWSVWVAIQPVSSDMSMSRCLDVSGKHRYINPASSICDLHRDWYSYFAHYLKDRLEDRKGFWEDRNLLDLQRLPARTSQLDLNHKPLIQRSKSMAAVTNSDVSSAPTKIEVKWCLPDHSIITC